MIEHLVLLKIRNMMDVKGVLLQWFVIFFFFLIKKLLVEQLKNENVSNKELAKELHKPIIKKFKKRKVHSSFIDNIWGTDLADMLLLSEFSKVIRFLLSVIYNFSK